VVQLYLEAWQQGNFEAMYSLLSPESQARAPFQTFLATHQHVLNQTTATQIQTQLHSLLIEDVEATATYHSQWVTALFDTLEADHTMRLRFDQGRWLVVWAPTLILPQLGYNVTLALLEEKPQRGLIYDNGEHALALQKQMVTIGVVPDLVNDEANLLGQLSQMTRLQPHEIQARMAAARPDWFVPLADLSFEESVQYHDILSTLAGVERRPRPVRACPWRRRRWP
jgi:penicillin-binding protein